MPILRASQEKHFTIDRSTLAVWVMKYLEREGYAIGTAMPDLYALLDDGSVHRIENVTAIFYDGEVERNT